VVGTLGGAEGEGRRQAEDVGDGARHVLERSEHELDHARDEVPGEGEKNQGREQQPRMIHCFLLVGEPLAQLFAHRVWTLSMSEMVT